MVTFDGQTSRLQLLPETDPRLRQVCEDFNIEGDPNGALLLANALKALLIEYKAVGLAAPQVGVMARVFAFGNFADPESIVVAFNPNILDEFGENVRYEEGCVSFPGLFLRVTRKSAIRVRYTLATGATDTIKFDGMTARVFLHEYDHLNGITFTTRASMSERIRGRNKQKQLLRRMKAYNKTHKGKLPTEPVVLNEQPVILDDTKVRIPIGSPETESLSLTISS